MTGADYNANALTQHHLALLRCESRAQLHVDPPFERLGKHVKDRRASETGGPHPGDLVADVDDDASFYQVIRSRRMVASALHSFLGLRLRTQGATPVPTRTSSSERRALPRAPRVESLRSRERRTSSSDSAGSSFSLRASSSAPRWRKESAEWLRRKKQAEEGPRAYALRREASFENYEDLAKRIRSEKVDRSVRRSSLFSRRSSSPEFSRAGSSSSSLVSRRASSSCAAPLSADGTPTGLTTFYRQMLAKFPNVACSDARNLINYDNVSPGSLIGAHKRRASLIVGGSAVSHERGTPGSKNQRSRQRRASLF